MKKRMVFVYGVLCYLVFMASVVYAIGFVGNFLVPTTLDAEPRSPLWLALSVNLGLLTLFAVQHSVMARPAFKKWWTRYVPVAAERSTYVLLSSIALLLLFWLWQPLGGSIWQVDHSVGRMTLFALYAYGWMLVFVSTFLINHFDLFGLRQVWIFLRGGEYTSLRFKTPGLYRWVRHPLYLGWLFVFWATPTMTLSHLLFALATTAYIFIGIFLEERDLVTYHGDEYRDYQKKVPMIIPRGRRIGRKDRQAASPARG